MDHKDITIGDHKYRVGRLPARAGAWILSLSAKEMKGTLSESEYTNIQQHLLSVCSVFVDDVPIPVLKADGSFSPKAKHLEYDLKAIVKLQKEAKDFNFADFFEEWAREIKEAAQAQSSSNSSE